MAVWRGVFLVGWGRTPRAGPSARESRAHAAGRGGYGRDKRGPPVWRRAISLWNGSAGSVHAEGGAGTSRAEPPFVATAET